MADFLASGRLVDLILLIVLIEAVAIVAYWRATGRGIAPRDLIPNLMAGALLLLALRLSLTGSGWPVICLCLAAAGVANAIDVMRRWRE